MRIVLMTAPPDQAAPLLRRLLQERLVACGNVVTLVRSMYWWQGEICEDDEALVIMETAKERASATVVRIRELHPYDVPKIIVLSPDDVDPDYRSWCRAETLGAPTQL